MVGVVKCSVYYINACHYYASIYRCNINTDCVWDYTATSVYYQVLAGPAFIVTFAVSSLFMGLLASTSSLKRTLVLSVCGLVWSILTGLSGFCNEYWQLLLTRIGLGLLYVIRIIY